jgi:hypothetical protein
MFELSKTIYALLNVAAIKNVATGGVWPLLAEQEVFNFITYALVWQDGITKNSRTSIELRVDCYAKGYNEALIIHDAVEKVLHASGVYLTSMEPDYTHETTEAIVKSTYTFKTTLTIN